MKRFFELFILMLGISIISSAQPTLTNSMNPTVGESVTSYMADTVGIQQGPAGASVTWDFANLMVDPNNPATIYYVSPAGTPYVSSFPDANLAVSEQGGNYQYHKAENDKLTNLGYSSDQSNMIYTDPQQMMAYPFTFDSQFNDSFQGTGVSGGLTMENAGSLMCKADAWGTLILPTGTYNNVLRIKTTMVYTSTFFGITTNITFHSYSWYEGDRHYPLMTLNYITMSVMGNITKVKAITVSDPNSIVPDLFNDKVSFNLFPNPVVSDCYISVDLKDNSEVTVSIIDMAGSEKQVYHHNMETAGLKNYNFNLDDLAAGTYIARLRIGERILERKFLVR